jgi:molecular chaperone GrpE (heat shock protein)
MREAAAVTAEEATPSAPPRRDGRQAGYEGKVEFGAADQQLRRVLSRLARDPDPAARAEGAHIVQEAIETLQALARRGEQASTQYKRQQAELERLQRRVDRQLAEAEKRHGGRGGSP